MTHPAHPIITRSSDDEGTRRVMPKSYSRRKWLAFAVLAMGIILTLALWLYVRNTRIAADQARYEAASRMLAQSISTQLDRYIDTLRATRGFYAASESISRQEWQTFTSSINLEKNYPGIQGIGFARRVNPENVPHHEATIRAEGFPDYQLHPKGPRDIYFPIVYIEPFDERNRRAFGYDMFSEPARRAAMQRAALTGMPAATGKLQLVQETTVDVQPGMLIYLPVYCDNMPLDTPQQRWTALTGFVYSPYRIHNLIRGILGESAHNTNVEFRIYDGTTTTPENLLFDSQPGQPTPSEALLASTAQIEIAGQPWTLRFYTGPDFHSAFERYTPTLVLLGGLLVSFLLFGTVWLQIRGRDISESSAIELARSERAVRASELRYRLMIEQSPVAIEIVAADGRITYVNPAYEALWQIPGNAALGFNLLDDPELARKGARDDILRAFAGETVVVGPLLYEPPTLPDGTQARTRWVRAVIYPIKPDGGTVTELVILLEDFTQRIETDAELHRAKEAAEAANAAKDQFLAVLSHELRNPLAPVLTTVNTMQSGPMTPDEFANALDVIQRNVELEARLIDDLLDITRVSRGKLHLDRHPIDAHLVLKHAVEICQPDARAKRLLLTTSIHAPQHHVNADPARLQQVFWNILKNAVKFTPTGGSITVATRNDEHNRLLVEITDNGIGIEPHLIPRIFDAFEQANPAITRRFGGLGLGLAISKTLVEAHGGTLTAHSDGPDRGTTFTLTLHTVPAPAPAAKPRDAAPSANGWGKRILLVEDQPDARRGLQKLLEKTGFHVLAAETVNEALKLAQNHPFDILLSDVGLPDGTGYDLMDRLREADIALPAIALTGLGMEDDIARAHAAGFQIHLTKPVQFNRLIESIESLAPNTP